MAFALTLSAPSTTPVSVQWTTTPGTATPGVDYTASSGTYTFPTGTMAGQVLIPILPDTVHEGDETFTVVLSSPVGASLQRATGTATILNDD
jgi:chitinase